MHDERVRISRTKEVSRQSEYSNCKVRTRVFRICAKKDTRNLKKNAIFD